MPSLPTSLIIVVLVAAWLVVLVPMVSKRREEVPEAEDGTAQFRVLERRERRAQPVLTRTARVQDVADSDDTDDADAVDTDGSVETVAEAAEQDPDLDAPAVVDGENGSRRLRIDPGFDTGAGGGIHDTSPADRPRRVETAPTRRRTGRGGYDPRAAERLRQDRFHRRRRTALVLVVASLAGAAIGLFGIGYGYVATAVFGSMLALYLAYLRRQVRIEEEIRLRRAARLERARQIRPNYRPSVAEQVWMHRTGETARPRPGAIPEMPIRSHVRQTVPAAQYGHAVALDLDDSDPAFDELAYYRPAASRRRAS